MKPLPLLLLTNLGLLGVLVAITVLRTENDEIRRSAARGGLEGTLFGRVAELEQRIRQLAQEMKSRSQKSEQTLAGVPPLATALQVMLRPASELTELDTRQVDFFRKAVRRAIELNRGDDRVAVIAGNIKDLVRSGQGRYNPVTDKKMTRAARDLAVYAERVPDVWRRARGQDGKSLSWDQRRPIVLQGYETLRNQARQTLETYLSPDLSAAITERFLSWGSWRGSAKR